MPNPFKLLKGYTPYEKKMSTFLSVSPYPPTNAELTEMYRLFISTYRVFTDLHLLLIRHLLGLDHATKFLRGIYFLSFVFAQLYPLRHQGVCEDLIELDLADSQPIPFASLFLHLHIQTLEEIDIFRGVQYYGNRVEMAHTKKCKNNTSQAPLNSTYLFDDTTNNANKNVTLAPTNDYDNESSINTRSLIEPSSVDLLSSTESVNDSQLVASSSADAILFTTIQSSDTSAGSNSNDRTSTSGAKYICPPGGFITSLYELYSSENISIAQVTGQFVLQLQSYSLSYNPDGHALQQIDFTGGVEAIPLDNESVLPDIVLTPSMLPPSLRHDDPASPVVPAGPPPSLSKIARHHQHTQVEKQVDDMSDLVVFQKK